MSNKIWLVKHDAANIIRNLVSFSIADQGDGWISPIAVNAFLRKRDADKWVAQNGPHYKVIGVDLPKSNRDARRTYD